MYNKQISKQILCSVQMIVKLTKDKELTDELLVNLKSETETISDFFLVTKYQAVVLALYLEYGYRDRDVDNDKIISQFGKNLGAIADVTEAIKELLLHNLLVECSSLYYKFKSIGITYKIHRRALQAMLNGDKELLEKTKVENFIDLITEVEEIIKLVKNESITTLTFENDLKCLLSANKSIPEVKWLLSHATLQTIDLAILLQICIYYFNGIEAVNLEEILSAILVDTRSIYKFKKNINEGSCDLFNLKLIEYCNSGFASIDNVRLGELILNNLSGFKTMNKSNFKPTTGLLLNPDEIIAENLYYNDEIQHQISILTNVFEEEQYQQLTKKLQDNKINTGFTVLLHGYPGTGKTSSVKQIAKSSGRNIFIVEIQKIQSKWVGESEKNISKIFEEYKQCKSNYEKTPILLFNEADAILGKRMYVSSSVDKMNNTIQNLLLQYLEDFNGIFFATTNSASFLDTAFDRRFLYKVEFNKPSYNVRQLILRNAFSEFADETLKLINDSFELTGGQILNIKKKLFISSLLQSNQTIEEVLFQLCKDEFSLKNNHTSNPIGFIKR